MEEFVIRLENGELTLRPNGRTTYPGEVAVLAYLLSGAYRIPRDEASISEIPGFVFSYKYDERRLVADVKLTYSFTSCYTVEECGELPSKVNTVDARVRFANPPYSKECSKLTEASKTDVSNLRSAYGYLVKAVCEPICKGRTDTYEEMKKLVAQKLSFREMPFAFSVKLS